MGYTTDFEGEFTVTPTLTAKHRAYLTAFSETRRMKLDVELIMVADPDRAAVGLPIGVDGEFFVGADGFRGQSHDESILDYSVPPASQPGLWCQWIPSEDGTTIGWDGGEKFYDYVDWIKYLIDRLLAPWGYKLNGTVTWLGEDPDDRGRIVIADNLVMTERAVITWEPNA